MITNDNVNLDICVLIPCYNNVQGLLRSVNSIIYHPHRFMVLIVDDGSQEPVTRRALYKQVPMTVNIQVIRIKENRGITVALNTGLDFIAANYPVRFIARLDCGDICHPDRFYTQVDFLDNNPEIELVGSWCHFKDHENNTQYKYTTPTRHESIRRSMSFRNVFVHPTVMWRATYPGEKRYPYGYPHAEDYGLFYDIVLKKRTAIIDKFLVTCEINKLGISFLHRPAQLKSRLSVVRDFGKNRFLKTAGSIKLLLLMALPHRLIQWIKKKF